jgi:hypothetical protein
MANSLKLCVAPDPKDARPTAFESKPGSRLRLITLERYKE